MEPAVRRLYCKYCGGEIQSIRRWMYCSDKCAKKGYQKDHPDYKKRYRDYYNTHKEQATESSKKYYQEHKEELLAYHREHYKQNKKRYIEQQRKWRKAHKTTRLDKFIAVNKNLFDNEQLAMLDDDYMEKWFYYYTLRTKYFRYNIACWVYARDVLKIDLKTDKELLFLEALGFRFRSFIRRLKTDGKLINFSNNTYTHVDYDKNRKE